MVKCPYMEEWKDIPGFEDFYLASSFGRIMSIAPGRARTKGRLLTPRSDGKENGYLVVCLYKGGEKYYKKVHRLVAETFIDNPDNKKEVNHKDGNKRNNVISNLEWVSGKENMAHAVKNGALNHNYHSGIYARKIRCVETGCVFNNAVDAARKMELGTSPAIGAGMIRSAIRGLNTTRRAYGYHWEELE